MLRILLPQLVALLATLLTMVQHILSDGLLKVWYLQLGKLTTQLKNQKLLLFGLKVHRYLQELKVLMHRRLLQVVQFLPQQVPPPMLRITLSAQLLVVRLKKGQVLLIHGLASLKTVRDIVRYLKHLPN